MAITRIDVRKESVQTLMGKAEIGSGRYWLPSFQRLYKWESDKIRSLLDSMFRNYPIGSIILWKPSARNAPEVDPTAIPLMKVAEPVAREPLLIIDGQQRLTSLLLLFNDWHIERGENETPISREAIAYEPGRDRFIISKKRGHDFSKIVRAFCLSDVDALKELQAATRQDVFRQMQDKATKLLQYPLSLYIMETDVEDTKTFADMAHAFVRINKEGEKIGNVELMLSFVAGTVSGALKQKIMTLNRELTARFDMAPQPTIRFVFSNFDLKQTQVGKVQQFESNIEKIREVTPEKQDSIFQTSTIALRVALDFLAQETGIKTSQLLPSQNTLVPLAAYCHKRNVRSVEELSEAEARQMLCWFILANFHGHYSASADSKLDRDLKAIKEADLFPFASLLELMPPARRQIREDALRKSMEINVLKDAGRAYLFLLYILLVRGQADDWSGTLIKARRLDELERHHIFPQEYLRTELQVDDAEDDNGESRLSNLGNISFVLSSVNSEISDDPPSDYLRNYRQSLDQHFIPSDENLWTAAAYEEERFQEWRIREIYRRFKAEFPEISAGEEPSSDEPAGEQGRSAARSEQMTPSVRMERNESASDANDGDSEEEAGGTDDLTEAGQLRVKYWTALLAHLKATDSFLRCSKPRPRFYLRAQRPLKGYVCGFEVKVRDKYIDVYLATYRQAKMNLLRRILKTQKDAFERDLGATTEWNDTPNRIWVCISQDADPSNTKDWPRQHDWMRNSLENLVSVFTKYATST
jgi:hypothetical protein